MGRGASKPEPTCPRSPHPAPHARRRQPRARRARRPSFVHSSGRGAELPPALPAPHLTRGHRLRPNTTLPRQAQGPAPRSRRAAPRSSLLPGAARPRAPGAPRRRGAPGSFGRGTRDRDASRAATEARPLPFPPRAVGAYLHVPPPGRPTGSGSPLRSARLFQRPAALGRPGAAARGRGPLPRRGRPMQTLPAPLSERARAAPLDSSCATRRGAGGADPRAPLRESPGSPARASAWSPRCGGSLHGPRGTPLLPGWSWVSVRVPCCRRQRWRRGGTPCSVPGTPELSGLGQSGSGARRRAGGRPWALGARLGQPPAVVSGLRALLGSAGPK